VEGFIRTPPIPLYGLGWMALSAAVAARSRTRESRAVAMEGAALGA
jgi:hypothetical protein